MVDRIAPLALKAWIAQQDEPAVVLDCREMWELQIASITADGFALMHIPMNEVPAKMSAFNVNQPIAVLCHHGSRSQRVAQYLAQNGFTNVANIEGGIAAWSHTVDASVPQY